MKLLFTFLTLMLCNVTFSQCVAPTGVTATNVTQTSVTLNWTAGSQETSWGILVLPAGSPPPTAATSAQFISTNMPFTVSGLACGIYTAYVRAICATGESSQWGGGNLQWGMINCNGQLGSLIICDTDNDGTEIVDLTTNEEAVLGLLPPGDYNITYHFSFSDAEAGTNDLPTLFTVPFSPATIVVRAELASNPSSYTLFSYNVLLNPIPAFPFIPDNAVCDNNGDGIATFDLGITSQFIYSNTGQTPNTWNISFYETISDAEAGANPIFNSYENLVPNQQTLYVRITDNASGCASIETVTLRVNECGGLNLVAFLDLNGNGTKEPGESNFTQGQFNYQLNGSGPVHNITSPSGLYSILDDNTNHFYDFGYTLNSGLTGNFAITTASYSFIFVTDVMETYYFPITVIQPFNDLQVSIIANAPPRPGFQYSNIVRYSNMGTSPMSGVVTFTKDPLVTILTISEAGATPNPNGFAFNFNSLSPFESRDILVNMQVPTIPTVALGALLTSNASITVPTGDASTQNNASVSAQIIIGAYDPNDKMESRGPQILFSNFSSADYLYYTIRFENTGTASAENVRVTDMLDPKLDETSVRMIGASGNYVLDRVNNLLTWNFAEIALPPSNASDPTTGHGYIHFKVKPKVGYAVGDIIPNKAEIYFDFNPAIVTDTFFSTFVNALGVSQFSNNGLTVYPNPASDAVTVSANEGFGIISDISIYDLLGKNLLTRKVSSATEIIDVSGMSSGIYIIEVKTDKIKLIKKLVIN